MVTAVKYLGAVGIGVTKPRLFLADDGNVYVVKLQNNKLGTKALVNEWIGARIGERMGLCFPPADLIMLSSGLIDKEKRRSSENLAGPHFASLYLRGSQYVNRTNLMQVRNKQQMAGVILFDVMFCNLDRAVNGKNLIICSEGRGKRIYAIDNSHLFYSGRWDAKKLGKLRGKIDVISRRFYGILLKHTLRPVDFECYVERVREINFAELEEIVTGIPPAWLPDTEEREILLDHLCQRCGMVDIIAQRIIRLIPDKNRRANIDKSK